MHRPEGFTIVETMIFLAISSLMFVGAAILFGGVQTRNNFNQAMRDTESKLNDIVNDVETGYYLGLDGVGCDGNHAGGTSPTFPDALSGATATRNSCVVLGNVLQFRQESAGAEFELVTVPVIGNRLGGTGPNYKDVINYADARPTTLFSDNPAESNVSDNAVTRYELRYGLKVKATPTPSYAGAFLASLIRRIESGTTITESSSGTSNFYELNISSPTADNLAIKHCVDKTTAGCFPAAVDAASSVPSAVPWVICFERSDGRETAQISINPNSLTTKLEFIQC